MSSSEMPSVGGRTEGESGIEVEAEERESVRD